MQSECSLLPSGFMRNTNLEIKPSDNRHFAVFKIRSELKFEHKTFRRIENNYISGNLGKTDISLYCWHQ